MKQQMRSFFGRFQFLACLFAAGLLAASVTALADTLAPSDDTASILTFTAGRNPVFVRETLANAQGAAGVLPVSKLHTAYLRFHAAELLEGTAVTKATLTLYFPTAARAGTLTLSLITSDWAEKFVERTRPVPTVAPAFASIPADSVIAKKFVIIDVTDVVKAWLANPNTDFGFAITSPDGVAIVTVGAKEGPASGYPVILEVNGNDPADPISAISGTFTGNVTAGGFSGDGSGLTGLTSGSLAAGSITSTQLAHDLTLQGATTFGGTLSLAVTADSSTGVISQGGTRLLHTYGKDNLFAGLGAGNFTLTGQRNTAAGSFTLSGLTSGSDNIAVGDLAGKLITAGDSNIDIGHAGVAGDTKTIRIGDGTTQTDTFLTGKVHGDGSGLTGLIASAASITGSQLAPGAALANLSAGGLSQIEPRTAIVSLPYTISTPGAYFLAGNLAAPSDGSAGITVNASNVTIDLQGFALTGPGSGAASGIVTAASVTNVSVINGSVVGWGGHGIDTSAASNSVVRDVRALSNLRDGFHLGADALALNCTARSNGANGLSISDGGTVKNCLSAVNGGDGILLASFCLATGNNCSQNTGSAGIETAGSASRIEANQFVQNARGLKVAGLQNLAVANNARSSSVLDYDIAAGNDYGQILARPGGAFTSANSWANFSGSCPAGQASCGGICANFQTDPNNCGACGNVCAGTQSCVSGTCTVVCPAGQVSCGGTCTNRQVDSANCGGCGSVCASGSICSSGVCQVTCQTGQSACSGICTNRSTDRNNCGNCGVVCASGSICVSSTCQVSCQSNLTNCSNTCRDLQNDNTNCGTCGHACSGSTRCVSGTCI